MNLGELKSQVERVSVQNRDDTPVVIRLDTPSIGSSATAGIKFLHTGFDWDNGKLYFEPEVGLTEIDNTELYQKQYQGVQEDEDYHKWFYSNGRKNRFTHLLNTIKTCEDEILGTDALDHLERVLSQLPKK